MEEETAQETIEGMENADAIAHVVRERLQKIKPLIPANVKLVAVTKTFPAEVVRAAYALGIRNFAENKAQEALAKQAELSDLTDIVWHFIGHVQSNKSRKVVEHFDWIHSVDSLKLAARLDRQAAELGKRPTCCLQVKLALDPTKDGFERDQLMAALADLNELKHLNIVGLMVIAPYGLPAEETQAVFGAGQALAAEIKMIAREQGLSRIAMDELSMGMSGDFEWAIAQGATLVRLGSSLFGSRHHTY